MPGKSSRLVTVFGAGGFIGRYVSQALFGEGVRVRVAQRNTRTAHFLRPLGRLGQTQFVTADITRPDSVAAAVEGADAVINLVGVLKGNFRKIHVDGARNVAEAAAAAGVRSLVQVSAIGADPESRSAYGRSKGEGELAVREAYPEAVLVRPSIVFGQEDWFINRFAAMAQILPFVPVLRPTWRVQPVYAVEVGNAIAATALDPDEHGGKTFELAGPQIFTMRELNEWICRAIGRETKPVLSIPDSIGSAMAAVMGWLPGAPITWDQWVMLRQDNVASGEHPGLAELGIRASPLAAAAEGWLPIFRRRGRWATYPPY